MKNKIIITIITLGLMIGGIFSINWLIKEDNKDNKQYEEFKSINETTNDTTSTNTTTTKKTTKKVVKTTKKNTKKVTQKVTVNNTTKKTSGYRLTHYGWDCCKSGVTATGYDIRKTIYYNDATYGKVRIVAMCSKIPLYSVIKIKDYKFGGDTLAIVLDRGVGCSTIDLAVKNEKTDSKYGIQKNVQIEILRKGK